MREDNLNPHVAAQLLQDVMLPSFYSDIVELEGIEITQGSHFIDKPHYQKKEQFVCLIEGFMDIWLVPQLYRQELYTGSNLKGTQYFD